MEIPKRLWIGMLVLGACARLVFHPVDFTPVMAIGLFAGSQSRKASTGVLATLMALALMVWATEQLYPHTAGGLEACYLAGIPFYRNQVLGGAVYTAALFGGYAVLSRFCPPARQAA